MKITLFNRKKAAQIEHAPATPEKETQHTKIVRLLSKRNIISPQDCLRYPCITTKLSTRIGEIERKSGVTLIRKTDPNTRFRTYECATVDDLETLRAMFLPEYKPLNCDR